MPVLDGAEACYPIYSAVAKALYKDIDKIEKQIHEDVTYGDIYESEDNLWNFLFFTGYMKKVSERKEGNSIYLTLKIPNAEIAGIYENQIIETGFACQIFFCIIRYS